MASLFQFSIRSLLIGVTIAAVGIAALLNAGPWWEAAMWGGTLLLLALSLLLIVYRRQEGRAYWVGFAVLGWLYLAAIVYSWTPFANSKYTRRDPLAQKSLITTRIAQLAYDSLLPEAKRQPNIADPGAMSYASLVEIYMADDSAAAAERAAAARARMDMTAMMSGASAAGTATVPNPSYVPIASFLHVAHALWLLLIAAIGGKTCQLIYRTRPNKEE